MQPTYIRASSSYKSHIVRKYSLTHVTFFAPLSWVIHHFPYFPFVEIINLPKISVVSLMIPPSCLHTLWMMCNVTKTSLLYIQFLGVTIESPLQVNIKLGFSCGCESPTQSHKSHHQTHETPTQIQGGFHHTKSVMWFP
jgi:hypothetical protein